MHILKFLSLSTNALYINVINFFAAQKSCKKRKYYNLILLEYVYKYMITPRIEVKNPVFCRRHEAQNIKTKI